LGVTAEADSLVSHSLNLTTDIAQYQTHGSSSVSPGYGNGNGNGNETDDNPVLLAIFGINRVTGGDEGDDCENGGDITPAQQGC